MELETSLLQSKTLNLPPLFCSKHGNVALSLCFSQNCSDPVLCLNCFCQIVTSDSSIHKEHKVIPIFDVEAQIKQTNEVKLENIDSQYEKLKENLPHLVKKHNLHLFLEIGKSIVNEKYELIGALHKEDSLNIVSMVNDIIQINQYEKTFNEEAQKYFDQIEAQFQRLEEEMSKVALFLNSTQMSQSLLANSLLSKESEKGKSKAMKTKEVEKVIRRGSIDKYRMSSGERINRLTSSLVKSSLLDNLMRSTDDEHAMQYGEKHTEAAKEEYSDNNCGHNRTIANSQLLADDFKEENKDPLGSDDGAQDGVKLEISMYDEIPTVPVQLPSLKKAPRKSAKNDVIEEMEEAIGSEEREEENEYRQDPTVSKKRKVLKTKSMTIGSSDLFGQVLSTNASSIKCLTREFKTSKFKLLDEEPTSITIASMDGGDPSLLFTSSFKPSNNNVCCYELNQSLELSKQWDVANGSLIPGKIKIMTTIRFRAETYLVMLGGGNNDKPYLALVTTKGVLACKVNIDCRVNCLDYFHEHLFLGTAKGMQIYKIIIISGELISLKRSGINLESMKNLYKTNRRLSRFHILQSDRENSQDGAFDIRLLCYYSTGHMLVLHTLIVTYSENNWILSSPRSKLIDTNINMTSGGHKTHSFIGFGSTVQEPNIVYCLTKCALIKLNLASPKKCSNTKIPNIVELQDFKMITLNGGEKDKKGGDNAVNIKFILLDVDGCLVMDYINNEMIVEEPKFKYDIKWDKCFPKAQLLFRSSQDFRLLVLSNNSILEEILLEAAN